MPNFIRFLHTVSLLAVDVEITAIFGQLVKLVIIPVCHTGVHGFESRTDRFDWGLSSVG